MATPPVPVGSDRHLGGLVAIVVSLFAVVPPPPVMAQESQFKDVVKGFCLAAFQSEMVQAGKQPPAGMANFACACVAERISGGSSVNDARTNCRQATARRYPI